MCVSGKRRVIKLRYKTNIVFFPAIVKRYDQGIQLFSSPGVLHCDLGFHVACVYVRACVCVCVCEVVERIGRGMCLSSPLLALGLI